jgi:hypothetical protein
MVTGAISSGICGRNFYASVDIFVATNDNDNTTSTPERLTAPFPLHGNNGNNYAKKKKWKIIIKCKILTWRRRRLQQQKLLLLEQLLQP